MGIATTSISLVREHTEKVKPPRALYVPFPFGHASGRPDDPELQHDVLRAALDRLLEPAGRVLRDFPEDAEPGDQPPAPPQASGITPAEQVPDDVAMETTQMRRYHERWLEKSGGRTLLALTGIPATRFRGVVRFLEGFADGQDVDMPERPPDLPLPSFVRYCADDLKALYFEGHLAMKPAAGGEQIARWFWGETGSGRLPPRGPDLVPSVQRPRGAADGRGEGRGDQRPGQR